MNGILSYVGSFFAEPPPSAKFADRHVLVAGCDAGIGGLVVKALHRRGYCVHAGCQTEAVFKEFLQKFPQAEFPKLNPFILDTTKDFSIAACARTIANKTKEKGLFALITNVSCHDGFAFELTPDEEISKAMDLNFMGPIRIIKAVLPSLRQNIKHNRAKPSKDQDITPRIINITSVLGRTTMPFYGADAASKHALEAMLDTIRVELQPWKIHVIMVEPGPIRQRPSNIPEISTITEQTLSLYGEEYIERAFKFWTQLHTNDQDSSKGVVRACIEAVEVGFPKDRYVVGTAAKVGVLMHNVLPRWVIDLAWGSMIRLIGAWPKQVKELEDGVAGEPEF